MDIALLTALIAAGAALFGTWFSNRHNRQLKLIELREQTASTIRQEKRQVYLELLRANRMSVQYAVQLGYADMGQQLNVDLDAVEAASAKFQRLIPELELVASREVYDLSQELYRVTDRCNDTMYRESEKRFAPFERSGEEPSLEQKVVIWEEVRSEVQRVYEQQGMEHLYRQVRNQIRQELGFLALDPSLVPTPQEIEKLREELSSLDQMRLRSDDEQARAQSGQ